MKKKIFYIFSMFHIAVILWVSFASSYITYCDFYQSKQSDGIQKFQSLYSSIWIIGVYMRYTGTETGYGFFAPNVRSNGLLIGETDMILREPSFRSFEGKNRFTTLSSQVTEQILKNIGDTIPESPDIIAKKWENYYTLILNSITQKTYQGVSLKSDSLTLSYNLIDYPSLQAASYAKSVTPNLLKIKKIKFLRRYENSN